MMLRRKNEERKEGGRKEERKGRGRNKDQNINNERKRGKKKRTECDCKEVTFKQKPVWAIKGLGLEGGQGV